MPLFSGVSCGRARVSGGGQLDPELFAVLGLVDQICAQRLLPPSLTKGAPGAGKTRGWLGRAQARAGQHAFEALPSADMKQGLLSVGIGGRESRSGCLDVEKGESCAQAPQPQREDPHPSQARAPPDAV